MSSTPNCNLAAFSTCEISDALLKLGLSHGGHIPDISLISPSPTADTKLCGPAYTVQMVMASDTQAPKLSSHFVDTSPSGSVIVINAPQGAVYCFSLNIVYISSLGPLYRSQERCLGRLDDRRGTKPRRSRCHHIRPL
jgi:hypothetical protein